jgi:hypothetical protein
MNAQIIAVLVCGCQLAAASGATASVFTYTSQSRTISAYASSNLGNVTSSASAPDFDRFNQGVSAHVLPGSLGGIGSGSSGQDSTLDPELGMLFSLYQTGTGSTNLREGGGGSGTFNIHFHLDLPSMMELAFRIDGGTFSLSGPDVGVGASGFRNYAPETMTLGPGDYEIIVSSRVDVGGGGNGASATGHLTTVPSPAGATVLLAAGLVRRRRR